MIEVIFLMMLGNADVLADLQIDIDELKEKVEKLELEYEEIKEKRTAKEIKMNVIYVEYEDWDKKSNNDEESDAMKIYLSAKAREVKDLWREEYRDLKEIEKQEKVLEHELETSKVLLEKMEGDFEKIKNANSNPDRYTNVSLSLSKNCQIMIKYQTDTQTFHLA
jgi:FtsZ-binding cell division protein ZapB